jgi:hypothetical protein
MRRRVLLLIGLAAACDPAVRTDTRAGSATSGELRSRELETCARSADCAGELRCFDGVCRVARAPLGAELQTAIGDRALAAGKANEAAGAYGLAVAEFDKEKLAPPADLLCNLGRAMVADLGDRGALAARALHRCLLAAPTGSELRRRALLDVAALVELGLDPALMGRTELGADYALKAPPAPPSDSLEVKVAVQSRSRAASLKKFTRILESRPEVKSALAGCWKAHWDATRKSEMVVTVTYRYGFDLDALEDLDHTWIRAAEAEPPAEPPLADATRCVRAALDPLASSEGRKMREEARWDAAVTFTVAPGGT